MSAPRVPVGSVWRSRHDVMTDGSDALVCADEDGWLVLLWPDGLVDAWWSAAHIANEWERIA